MDVGGFFLLSLFEISAVSVEQLSFSFKTLTYTFYLFFI